MAYIQVDSVGQGLSPQSQTEGPETGIVGASEAEGNQEAENMASTGQDEAILLLLVDLLLNSHPEHCLLVPKCRALLWAPVPGPSAPGCSQPAHPGRSHTLSSEICIDP